MTKKLRKKQQLYEYDNYKKKNHYTSSLDTHMHEDTHRCIVRLKGKVQRRKIKLLILI